MQSTFIYKSELAPFGGRLRTDRLSTAERVQSFISNVTQSQVEHSNGSLAKFATSGDPDIRTR